MNKTSVRAKTLRVLEAAWTEPGFCVPNLEVYPHQWLWDSCFHSIIWAELGDARGEIELETALRHQMDNGFVPHMTYWSTPDAGASFWGRPTTSTITQPPMYGHAAAELARRGFEVSDALISKLEQAFVYLLEGRARTSGGLIPIYHPWESGCDDSPRWDVVDGNGSSGPFSPTEWKKTKIDLTRSLVFDEYGAPVGNPGFEVGSIGFNSLVVFNLSEFLSIPGVSGRPRSAELAAESASLRSAIAGRWSDETQTWLDDSEVTGRTPTSIVRRNSGCKTADSLLALLVDPRNVGFDQLTNEEELGGRFGPPGVHRDEQSYDGSVYWRGPSWPQLNYLLAVAARRAGNDKLGDRIVAGQRRGVETSGWAEYWNADTGAGLGAIPQTWSGLAIVAGHKTPWS